MRLDKLLSDMNLDSRSNLKKAIRKGNVTVNQSPVRDPAAPVSKEDRVTYFGRPVIYEEFQYFML
ncbi:MAG: S4 domain-containing protein, partial [Lachnospiraceae bacterium]|nr:S4 domain-containing protein [Lachnospiraceae bacterium]